VLFNQQRGLDERPSHQSNSPADSLMSNSGLRKLAKVSTFSLFPSASSGVRIAPPPRHPFFSQAYPQTEERCSGRPAVQAALRLVMVEITAWRSDSPHVVAYLRQHRQHRLHDLKRSSQGGGWFRAAFRHRSCRGCRRCFGIGSHPWPDPDCPRSQPLRAASRLTHGRPTGPEPFARAMGC
jgi:hypothetical protein